MTDKEFAWIWSISLFVIFGITLFLIYKMIYLYLNI